MKRLVVIAILLAAPLHADPLAQLRQVLARYPAKEPFRAEVSLQVRGDTQEREMADRRGATSFFVSDGPDGLSAEIPRPVLARASREATAKKSDPEALTPTRSGLLALTVFELVDAINAAEMLLHDLDRATLVSEGTTVREGRPVRFIVVGVRPTLAGTRSRMVEEPKIELRLFLSREGIPMAAERESTFAASLFMVQLKNVRKEKWSFRVSGDRLWASMHEEENRASGVGRNYRTHRRADLKQVAHK
jgi:hypothetical protein